MDKDVYTNVTYRLFVCSTDNSLHIGRASFSGKLLILQLYQNLVPDLLFYLYAFCF